MSGPGDLLDSLADSLGQVTGLRAHDKTPGNVHPPAAVCEIAGVTAPSAHGGTADYVVKVMLLVQLGEQRQSQDRTFDLIDPGGTVSTSAFAALLSNQSVGQVEFEGPGVVEYGGQQYVGGIFTALAYD
jgi:hypothetical protein